MSIDHWKFWLQCRRCCLCVATAQSSSHRQIRWSHLQCRVSEFLKNICRTPDILKNDFEAICYYLYHLYQSLGHLFSYRCTTLQLYDGTIEIPIICFSFNQSQYSSTVKSSELCCDWLKVKQKDGIYVVPLYDHTRKKML